MKWKGDVSSSFFPVHTGVRQGFIPAPSLFNTCVNWILGRIVDQSHCRASVGNSNITDLVFADDAVIFAKSLEVLVMALKALLEEATSLGLQVSSSKIKVQVFGSLLDETIQFIYACGESIDILDHLIYLGRVIYNNGGSCQKALRQIGLANGVMDFLSTNIWRCQW